MSFSLIYICCSFRVAFYLLFFYCSHISDPQGTWSALVSFPLLSASLSLSFCFYNSPFPSFSSMSVSVGILSVVFPAVAICFWPAGNLECPCLFSDLILFPFLLLFFYIVPYPSLSSMPFSLTHICCSFRGGILSVVFATVAICFWPAGNLECPCHALVSFPTLSSSLFSSFSSILFLTLPFLLCLFHWSISAVVSGEAF